MNLDLEPHEYRVLGRKEPILTDRWWIGLLAIALVFAVAFVSKLATNAIIPH